MERTPPVVVLHEGGDAARSRECPPRHAEPSEEGEAPAALHAALSAPFLCVDSVGGGCPRSLRPRTAWTRDDRTHGVYLWQMAQEESAWGSGPTRFCGCPSKW